MVEVLLEENPFQTQENEITSGMTKQAILNRLKLFQMILKQEN